MKAKRLTRFNLLPVLDKSRLSTEKVAPLLNELMEDNTFFYVPSPGTPKSAVLSFILPDKKILLGVIDLNDMNVETPETVAERIRRALPHTKAENIIVAPDCGMKYLPRDVAFGKMQAMVAGAKLVRDELSGG